MRQRPLVRTNDIPVEQPVNKLLLPLVPTCEEVAVRRRALCEDLTESAELEEGDRRIPREVLLRLGRKRDQPRVVVR